MTHASIAAASFLLPLGYAAAFVLLLAPAYALARAFVRFARLDRAMTPLAAYAFAALAGYLAFWCYFANPHLGRAVSLAWVVATPIALWALRRERLTREETMQLALTFTAGLLYLAVLYLPATTIGAGQRFFVLRPSDNVLPQIFAERLFLGVDPRPFIPGWLSSDRPPLQTGIDLLVRPLFRPIAGSPEVGYELAGIVAQLVWVPAAYLLALRAGLAPRARAYALALAIFSGYFLYNTVYTWPKLLAAGLCVGALLFALPREGERADLRFTLAGTCAALALLAHGSAVFFLVPAALLVLATRRLPLRRGVAFALVAAVVLLAPWSAYQRFYDPPGDRLLKMHLAGIGGIDPRPASAAIAQTYASTPVLTIVENKVANVQTALGDAELLGSAATGEPSDPLDAWRVREREHVTAALGAANAGWLALLWWWRRGPGIGRRGVAALLVLAAVTTAFWCLALWGPGATVTTHGAYVLDLLLFVALGAAVATLPAALRLAAVGLAAADFFVTWVAGSLPDAWLVAPSLDPVMALLALAAAALGALLLVRDANPAGQPPLTTSGI